MSPDALVGLGAGAAVAVLAIMYALERVKRGKTELALDQAAAQILELDAKLGKEERQGAVLRSQIRKLLADDARCADPDVVRAELNGMLTRKDGGEGADSNPLPEPRDPAADAIGGNLKN